MDDLFRFVEMLRNGGELDGVRILSPAMIEYASRNQTGELRMVLMDALLQFTQLVANACIYRARLFRPRRRHHTGTIRSAELAAQHRRYGRRRDRILDRSAKESVIHVSFHRPHGGEPQSGTPRNSFRLGVGRNRIDTGLALQISDHEARALVDERFHRFVRKHLGVVQHRVVRQRLDRGHANE